MKRREFLVGAALLAGTMARSRAGDIPAPSSDGLGLKPDEKLAGFIHIGTPTKPSEDRPRPFLSEIVTRF